VNLVPAYDSIAFGEAALKLRTHRHELLSANLVNSETPNYKARDIDFADVLQRQLAGQLPIRGVELQRTHPGHLSGRVSEQGPEQLFRVPVQPSVDGNTVDPDVERGHFVKNAMLTEATINFLGSSFRGRLSAITGQPQ
jgi:flagellar basal-body rod protein FlgB